MWKAIDNASKLVEDEMTDDPRLAELHRVAGDVDAHDDTQEADSSEAGEFPGMVASKLGRKHRGTTADNGIR